MRSINVMTKKEKKDLKVQIRITASDRVILDKLMEVNKDLSISKLFRDSLHERCKRDGI